MRPVTIARSAKDLSRARSGGVLVLAVVIALLLASCGAEEGQQGGEGAAEENAQTGEEAGQTRPVERVTVEELTDDPSEFYGQSVTVNGEVIEVAEPGAFRIEGDDDGELLVAGVQRLSETVKGEDKQINEGDRIRATGEVRQFNIEEVQQDVDYGIDNEYFGDFEGDPAVLARSVEVMSQRGGTTRGDTTQ